MADEIINRLGFDVTDALRALDSLDQKLKQVGQTMQAFASAGRDLPAVSKALGTVSTAMDGTGKAAERLTVSWGYLTSRILYTQMVVSYFGKLRRELEGAAESAVSYQRKVAEITTISDLSQAGAGGIVRGLSDRFNVPLLEEASALYQTLSNGITNAAEATQFLAETNKFAKASNSTTANSVDLLSGAIKSFGMSTEDTGKAAGVLFEAIRAGRIRADELGNSFGRVGPRAAQLGLSLEETAGALAAITIRGVKTSESITQLGGILTALTKPTEEMAAKLRALGFTSGEAAVATLKLPGLLQALADSTDGTSAAMARLFPNVRGIAGQLALTGKGLKEFATDVTNMEKAGAGLAQSKYLQATATDAERVTKELNRLKTAMTVDMGQAVLKAAADLSQWAGGADSVVQAVKAAGPVVLGLAAGFIGLRAALFASRLEAVGLARALGALALIPIAYGAGQSLGQYLDAKMSQNAESGLRQLEVGNAKALEDFKRQQSERRDAAAKADAARVQSALQVIQQLNQTYLQDVANAKTANDALTKNTEAGLSRILHVREQLVQQLERAAAQSADIVKASQDRITDLTAKSGDRQFRARLPADDSRQVFALSQRAQDMAAKAAAGLAKATDQAAITRALQGFSSAEKYAEEAQSIAQRTGNRGLEVRAAQTLNGITEQQIAAEKQLQALQAARLPALEFERLKQQAVVDTMRGAIKALLDNSKQFDASGKLLSADQLAKQGAARQEAMAKIAGAALNQRDLSSMSALGIADFVNRFQADLSREPIRLTLSVEESLVRVQQQIADRFARFRVGFDVAPLETALGKTFNTPDEVARGLIEAKQKAAELRAEVDKVFSRRPEIGNLQKEIDTLLQGVNQRADVRKSFPGDFSEGLRKQFDAAMKQFEQVRQSAKISDADIKGLFDAFSGINQTAQGNMVGRLGFGSSLQLMADAILKLKDLQGLQGKLAPDPAAVQQLENLEKVIQGLQTRGIGEAINAGVAPSARIAENLDLSSAVQTTARISANLWDAASAATSVAEGLSASSAEGYATGGPVYASRGFAPRGTDTIPAMLSPGEFVMNARSTRRFLGQLVAMNAGIQPVYRSEGGNVTAGILGDVSVTMNMQGGSQQSARDIARVLNHEIRRGTARLN